MWKRIGRVKCKLKEFFMRRTLFAVFSIVGLLAAPAAAQSQVPATGPTVSTEGRASLKVSPDIAWITVTAESRAVRTADAQKLNATAMDSVRASLKAAGLVDDAVKTRSYTVEPQMQYTDGKSKVIGYIARQSLDVRVDDLSKLGAVIDAAGGSGATSISDIRYDVKDRTGIETKLLAEAVRDGMTRATAMAAGAGKEVLTIWRIDEQRFSDGMPRPMMMRAEGMAADKQTVISPNELEIQARVAITVLLK
jgi:uncharacterized protein YggE